MVATVAQSRAWTAGESSTGPEMIKLCWCRSVVAEEWIKFLWCRESLTEPS